LARAILAVYARAKQDVDAAVAAVRPRGWDRLRRPQAGEESLLVGERVAGRHGFGSVVAAAGGCAAVGERWLGPDPVADQLTEGASPDGWVRVRVTAAGVLESLDIDDRAVARGAEFIAGAVRGAVTAACGAAARRFVAAAVQEVPGHRIDLEAVLARAGAASQDADRAAGGR
jgi:hypothetical protein